jgi:hypothetical protein
VDLCSCPTFIVGATGTPPLSYQWIRNGVNVAGATSSSYTICPITLADNGTILKVLITNACGSVVSTSVFLTVADLTPPTLNCPTNDIVASAGASGGTNVFYTVTATDCDTNVTIVCTPPAGSFFPCGTNRVACTATDSSGNHSTCSFNVVVLCSCIPPTITLQPTNQTVDLCSCATFIVGATGTPPLSYQWRKNGLNIAGATASIYTICPLRLADGGTYQVLVTNACGAVLSANAVLTVTDTNAPTLNCPTNDLVVNAGGASGTNVFFTVTATDCDTNVTIVCTPPSGSFFPCGTNRVTCTATDSSGNHSICSFNVIVNCGCLGLSKEEVNCTNGTALLNYYFTFQNNSSVPVKYLILIPNTNCFSFVPDIVTFRPPVLPGQTTNVGVKINVTSACSSNLCFMVAALDTNQVQCCAITHCVSYNCGSGVPPKLTITMSGGTVTVSWTGSGILQIANLVTGPWVDAQDQSNPQSFPPSGTQRYFRLRQ